MVFDNYQVTAAPAANPTTAPTLQFGSRAADGTITLRLVGQAGISYALDASPDLRTWTQISTLSSASGTSEFTDPTAANQPVRFYRAHSTGSVP